MHTYKLETGADDADMAYRVVAYHISHLGPFLLKNKLLLVKYLLANRRKDGYSRSVRFQETDELNGGGSGLPDNLYVFVRLTVFSSQESDSGPEAVELLAREIIEVATPGKVQETEMDRAKEATGSTVLTNLESREIC
ncbi:hypothetical protein MKW98_021423 [Papaver atlanticum]|uniref:Uncharacterized protein n=1 Tax=Papaver atlanticum TaxID=357466 RepID=A0AAD4XHM0_9MAGN|nr:hypothetical protein MKW98_021423 [Papaver atlanticum]